MSADTDRSHELSFPFTDKPDYGTTIEVAPGVRWLQMPLPMSLDHINLYLLEDSDGWIIVDTGIRGEATRELWLEIILNELGAKPVKRIICTHMHPDHTGQSGFLSDHCRAPLSMSYAEYYQARVMGNMMRDGDNWQMTEYFQRAGIDPNVLFGMSEERSKFTPEPDDKPLPGSFERLADGDRMMIAGRQWQVITGNGHSPEHVCLYCPDLKVMLSGDQVLPIITSNVSVFPTEPNGNPMVGWLESHRKFMGLIPDETLILPAHNAPFYGVQARLQQLIDHHEDRMLVLEENCIEPTRAIDLLPLLFKRKLDGHTMFMALGECVAHLHCLMSRDQVERLLDDDGVYRYRSIDPTLPKRARPGQHEEPDARPSLV